MVKEFDHPAFLITSKAGLQLVVLAIRKAMHGAFPVEELYKSWKNSEGQVSFFSISIYVKDQGSPNLNTQNNPICETLFYYLMVVLFACSCHGLSTL